MAFGGETVNEPKPGRSTGALLIRIGLMPGIERLERGDGSLLDVAFFFLLYV